MRLKVWAAIAGVCIHVCVVSLIAVMAQLSFVRGTSARMMRQLRAELDGYRMILIAPRVAPPQSATPKQAVERRVQIRKPQPKPLSVPDTRLLDSVDPQLAGFVRDNPRVESVVTRELVRDVDSGALDIHRLLLKSGLRFGFDIDQDGNVGRARIEKSSGVPSIDHLALELAKSINNYQFAFPLQDLNRIVISIEVAERIEVTLEGNVRDPEDIERVRKSVQNALALMRFALGADSRFLLQDASIAASDGRVSLVKQFEKGPLVDFLLRYYQPK